MAIHLENIEAHAALEIRQNHDHKHGSLIPYTTARCPHCGVRGRAASNSYGYFTLHCRCGRATTFQTIDTWARPGSAGEGDA